MVYLKAKIPEDTLFFDIMMFDNPTARVGEIGNFRQDYRIFKEIFGMVHHCVKACG